MRSNNEWTVTFLFQALYEIIALVANAAACGVAFYKVNSTAGLLFVPYLGWLSLATALTYSIYRNNPAIEAEEAKIK